MIEIILKWLFGNAYANAAKLAEIEKDLRIMAISMHSKAIEEVSNGNASPTTEGKHEANGKAVAYLVCAIQVQALLNKI